MYNSEKVANRKALLVNLKGNKCECCNRNFKTLRSANFHHIDSTTKKHNVANMLHNYSMDSIMEEIEKCVLLCSTCHDDLHGLYGESVTKEQTFEFLNM